MYEETSFPNNYDITKITLYKKVHCLCRLGGDWYTNQLTISFTPVVEIPDFVFIDKAIEERCERKDMIIEEVIREIKTIIKEQCPTAKDITIKSYISFCSQYIFLFRLRCHKRRIHCR